MTSSNLISPASSKWLMLMISENKVPCNFRVNMKISGFGRKLFLTNCTVFITTATVHTKYQMRWLMHISLPTSGKASPHKAKISPFLKHLAYFFVSWFHFLLRGVFWFFVFLCCFGFFWCVFFCFVLFFRLRVLFFNVENI